MIVLDLRSFTPILTFPHRGGRDFFWYPRVASLRGKGLLIVLDLRSFTPILTFPRRGGRDFFWYPRVALLRVRDLRKVGVLHPHPNLPPSRGKGLSCRNIWTECENE